MITADKIQGLEFFNGITDEQAKAISDIAIISDHQTNDVVQKEGDDCDAFFFVHSGLVALEISMQQDNDVTIDTIKSGELFGWSAFVEPHKVTAKSVCKEDVQLIKIPRSEFLALIEKDLHLRALVFEHVLNIVADRLKDTRSQLNYLLAWN